MTKPLTSNRFSLCNAIDDRPTDLPHLLRRLADQMITYDIDSMEIDDVVISSEMTADGPWWAVTVYWTPGGGVETDND